MGKIGGVQTLLNCSNLSSFPPKSQRVFFFFFFYASHESLCFSAALFFCSCASFVDRKLKTKKGRNQAVSSLLKTIVDSWLQM
ncbi:hypothetical protein DVH24_029193 [Malus domestica]|uniref:Uncharacterized protein n=1 Tax=Malus domestica TaxID=3750 RepID=A0A498HWY2_MALDO|nr:hypothetical protein DVH24_029193 [Malus domestica]